MLVLLVTTNFNIGISTNPLFNFLIIYSQKLVFAIMGYRAVNEHGIIAEPRSITNKKIITSCISKLACM